MKKTLVAIMILSACALSACGKNYSGEEVTTVTYENKFPDFVYDSNDFQYYIKDNHKVAVAEDGYYFARNYSVKSDNMINSKYYQDDSKDKTGNSDENAYGKILYYYDVNSETVTPLCSKIDCKHNNVECEAYFDAGGENDGGFVYYKHRLYMISYDDTSGTKLISFDENGHDKKEYCVINDNPEYVPYGGGTNDLCIFKNAVYSWGKRTVSIESQTIEIVLYRTDLKTNKTEKIMSYEKSAAQNSYLKDFDCDIQAVKDTLYIKTCSYDENDDMFIYTIYCTQGENLTELMKSYAPRDCNKRIEGNEYASIKGYAVNTKYIYYIDELSSDKLDIEAALFIYNIKTGEKEKIYDLPDTMAYDLQCDDDYIYINRALSSGQSGELCILDNDAKIIYQKEYNGYANLTACDERYIIMSTNDSETAYDEFVGKGEDVRDVNEISLLMVMLRKDEILSESKNWEIMYNGKFMQ